MPESFKNESCSASTIMSTLYKQSFCQLIFDSFWDCFGHSGNGDTHKCDDSTMMTEQQQRQQSSKNRTSPIYMICVRCSNEMLLNPGKDNITIENISTISNDPSYSSLPYVTAPTKSSSSFCLTSKHNSHNNNNNTFDNKNDSIHDTSQGHQQQQQQQQQKQQQQQGPMKECSVLSSMNVIHLLNRSRTKVFDTWSQPFYFTTPGPTKADSSRPSSRCCSEAGNNLLANDRMSPANYCRISTCEQLHVHELTPKCRETFAPSSTCSSCQYCVQQHQYGHTGYQQRRGCVNNSRCSMLGTPINNMDNKGDIVDRSSVNDDDKSVALTVPFGCGLQEYRPHNTPEHLYRVIAQ